MRTTISLASIARLRNAMLPANVAKARYKTIAIYPNFIDAGNAHDLLKYEGFNDDQISLIGPEQADWQERLGTQWKTLHAAKSAMWGGALGEIPGLELVAGISLSCGTGLLAAGPMVGALNELGLAALDGSEMGSAANNFDSTNMEVNVAAEAEAAIGLGLWLIVAHSHDEIEAFNAQALLPRSRIILQTETVTNTN